jgi:energy-coupling factor transporter ATP-binding protein EcfA2
MPGRTYTAVVHEPEVLYWEDFQFMFSQAHKQGEHVSLVGATGSGKSVCGLELCKIIGKRRAKDGRPARVTVLVDKPRDDTVMRLHTKDKWPIIKKWPPSYGQEHCIVWPKTTTPSKAVQTHRAVFLPLLEQIYHEGGQTVYIDEAAYFEDTPPSGLGMRGTMSQFWRAARSNRVSMVSATQRPTHVSRLMWSEPSWLFIFKVEDDDDLKRVAQLSGDKQSVWRIVPKLGGHEFLCVRRQRGGDHALYVSRVADVTSDNRDNRDRTK